VNHESNAKSPLKWTWGYAIVVLMVFSSGCLAQSKGPLSDKEMRAYFKAHQSDFQALIDIALHDSNKNMIIVLDSHWADKYRELMNRVGAREVFNGKTKGIAITSENWGDASKGIVLGYKWLPKSPSSEETVKNIDDLMKDSLLPIPDGGEHDLKYSPLEGNWYLVFQH